MAVALLLVFLGSLTVLMVGILGLIGKLPRNSWAGIRTPYTMSSDENWVKVHQMGSPIMIFGAVAALAASMAFLPFALAGKIDDPLIAIVALASAVILGASAIAAWLVGVARAKSTP